MTTLYNPLLNGFHPDPSVVKVGKDYYLATSTFEYLPGIPIHHSRDFEDWTRARLEASDRAALLNYRSEAPFAEQNHPTDEHLLPLFVAMGAAGPQARATQLHASFEHGILAMDAYAFA